jgi:phage-related protein
MVGSTITQRIALEGSDQIKQALRQIGEAGRNAFQQIRDAGQSVKLDAVEAAAKKAGVSVDEMRARVAAARATLDTLGATSREAAANATGMGRAARDAVSGLHNLNDASDQTGVTIGATDVAAIRFGQTLRLLGRAAGIHELSQLGRTMGVLGRAFEIGLPVLFVAALEKVAASAAAAADQVADLAAKAKVPIEQFQNLVAAESAIGQGAEQAGAAFSGLNNLIKETATNTQRNEQEFSRLRDQMQGARDKAGELAEGFTNINRQGVEAFRRLQEAQHKLSLDAANSERDFAQAIQRISERRQDITQGAPSASEQRRRQLRDLDEQEERLRQQFAENERRRMQEALKTQEAFNEAKRKQAEETRKLNDQIAEQDKKQREAARALALARAEAERNATALERLGINAVDAAGKLKKAPAVLLEIADALKNITDPDQREQIEFDLIAAGLDRKLIPALRRGADGFRELQAEGRRIRPPFTGQQIAIADQFQLAIGRLGNALGGLKDQFGLTIAPAFTAFFERVTEIVIANRDAIIEFGQILGSLLKPLLEGVAVLLNGLVVAFATLFATVAQGINAAFGTNLSTAQVFAGALALIVLQLARVPAAIALIVTALGKLIEAIDKSDLSPLAKTALKATAVIVTAFAVLPNTIIKLLARIPLAIAGIFGRISALVLSGLRVAAVLTTLFGGITAVVVRAGVAVAAFIATFVGLPAVIAVVIAAAVGFFAVWAIQNWEKIKAAAAATWQFLAGSVTMLWQSVQSAFQTGIGLITGLWSGVVSAAQAVWDLILSGAQALWLALTTVFATGMQIIGSAWTAVLIAADAIWALVAEGAQALWSALASIWQSGVSIIAGAWTAISGAAQALWAEIQSTFQAGFEFISQGWQVLVAISTAVFAQVAALAQAVWTAITSTAQSMWDSITGFFSAGVSAVIGFLQRVKDFALAVWNAITGAAKEAAQAQNQAASAGAGGFAGVARLSGPALRPAIRSRSGRRPANLWCGLRRSADMGWDCSAP